MFVRSFRALVIAGALSLLACGNAPSTSEPPPSGPAPTAAPGALQAAHEAYLAGDFVAVGERIHDVLLDPSSGDLAKENALELLDKSFAATNGKLPSRFSFPEQIGGMELGLMKGQNVYGTYRAMYLWLRVREGLAARVTNITVRRLPGEPILDRAAGRGKVKLRHDKVGFEDILLDATKLDSLPMDGVFSIRIDIDGVPVVDTWVLGSKLVASSTPEVSAPAASESFSSGNPTIRWAPFRSPEAAPFDDRTLSVDIHDLNADKTAWNFWTSTAGELETVRVGDHDGAAKTKLAPGSYWLALTAGENRTFGPITIARRSQAGVPFNVVK